MLRDTELQDRIMAELKWEPSVQSSEIGVSVRNAIVTLNGTVNTYAEKFAAERAVERVTGVRAIAEDLKVQLPGRFERSDTDIAKAALSAIEWDVEVPDDRIRIVVRDGWVTLEGKAAWFYQKAAAERAVRNLAGVVGVTNLIEVEPATKPGSEDVKAKIRSAMQRSAELDTRKIDVMIDNGTVTLKGTVRSWAEREDAERAAWSAPGVRSVKDELQLAV
ncbi:MAG TPA: BON domain-containing protein [Gemmatimonadaceae bacterium]